METLSHIPCFSSQVTHSAYNLLATTVQGPLSDLPMCPEEENTVERVNTQHCLPQLVYGETRILRKIAKYQKSIVFPLQYLVFPRLRESVSQKSESHMAQFVEYDTSRKQTGKNGLGEYFSFANLKHHKIVPLENLRSTDHELSVSCT